MDKIAEPKKIDSRPNLDTKPNRGKRPGAGRLLTWARGPVGVEAWGRQISWAEARPWCSSTLAGSNEVEERGQRSRTSGTWRWSSSIVKQGMQGSTAAAGLGDEDGVEANGSGRSLAGMKQERRRGT